MHVGWYAAVYPAAYGSCISGGVSLSFFGSCAIVIIGMAEMTGGLLFSAEYRVQVKKTLAFKRQTVAEQISAEQVSALQTAALQISVLQAAA